MELLFLLYKKKQQFHGQIKINVCIQTRFRCLESPQNIFDTFVGTFIDLIGDHIQLIFKNEPIAVSCRFKIQDVTIAGFNSGSIIFQ